MQWRQVEPRPCIDRLFYESAAPITVMHCDIGRFALHSISRRFLPITHRTCGRTAERQTCVWWWVYPERGRKFGAGVSPSLRPGRSGYQPGAQGTTRRSGRSGGSGSARAETPGLRARGKVRHSTAIRTKNAVSAGRLRAARLAACPAARLAAMTRRTGCLIADGWTDEPGRDPARPG